MSDKPVPQPPASLDQMTMEEKLLYIENLKKQRDALYAQSGQDAPPAPFTLASGDAPPWQQFFTAKPADNKPKYPAPKLSYGYAGEGGVDDDAGYFDDDEEEGDYDDELEQFEREMGAGFDSSTTSTTASSSAAASAFTGGLGFYAPGSDTQVDVVVTDPKSRRAYVGDFELLRLAKMGDLESFQFFAQQTQTDVKNFVDNKNRDALFYATDAGSVTLVKYLVETVQMGLRRDDKQMSPLDVAVVLGHKEIVAYLTEKFPLPLRTHAQLVTEFSPKPPKFCLSKAAAAVACDTTRKRGFWSTNAPAMNQVQSGSSSYAAESFLPGSMPAMMRTVLECSNRPFTGEQRGLHTWTFPVEEEVFTAVFPRTYVVGVTAASADSVTAAGMGFIVPLGGSLVVAQGKKIAERVALAANFSVLPQHQHKQVMAVALHKAREMLLKADMGDNDAVVFTSGVRVPTAEPVCTVKWFRRTLKPQRVFSRLGAAGEVFSAFFEFDDQLRVDAVLKETIRAEEANSQTIGQWQEADATNEEGAALLNTQIPVLLQKLGAELAFVPTNVLESLCLNGLRTFVMFDASGKLSDIVVVRQRNSRELATDGQTPSFGVASSVSALKACTVVFSAFSTIAADKRLAEMMVMAEMLQCDVLYVSNTCGTTESELSKNFFEEAVPYREMLYSVRVNTLGSVLPKPVPAGKVFIPFSLL